MAEEMSVDLATIHAEVKQGLFNRSDLETLIDSVINQVQLLLTTKLRIRELEVVATTTLVAPINTGGVWTFNGVAFNPAQHPEIIAQPSDFWAPVIMINTSKQRQEVKFKPLDVVLTMSNASTSDGGVTYVPIVGDPGWVAPRGTTFVLSPIPRDNDVLELTYRFKPAKMTATVGMSLPDEFQSVVTFQSLAHVMHLIGEEDRAQSMLAERDQALKSLGDQRGEEYLAMMEGMRVQWNDIEGAYPMWGR